MKSMRGLIAVMALAFFAGCGKTAEKVTVPSDPAGTVSTVVNSVADDKPQVLWSALPESYQKDVKGLIVDFGAKVDADVWDKTFVVLGKGVDVLDKKREFIFNHPLLADGPVATKKEEIQKQWDNVVVLLKDLVNSEIKTTSGIKNLDPGAFLADTGAKLSKNIKQIAIGVGGDEAKKAIGRMKDVKVTVEKSEGDKATLKMVSAGTETTEEVTKVDGKWLPSAMVANWDQGISQARTALAGLEMKPEKKEESLAALVKAEAALDAMLAADSQEAFNEAFAPVAQFVQFIPMMIGAGAGPGPGDFSPVAPGNSPKGFPVPDGLPEGTPAPDASTDKDSSDDEPPAPAENAAAKSDE